jgi:hypothetical protein
VKSSLTVISRSSSSAGQRRAGPLPIDPTTGAESPWGATVMDNVFDDDEDDTDEGSANAENT